MSDHDMPQAFLRRVVHARRTHACCECSSPIALGEEHVVESGIWDGSPSRFRTCSTCAAVRDFFAGRDGEFGYGELLETVRESDYVLYRVWVSEDLRSHSVEWVADAAREEMRRPTVWGRA